MTSLYVVTFSHYIKKKHLQMWIFFSPHSPAAAQNSSVPPALSDSQQKATFDLGSILLCLTTEHLNTRQVVFMTHRLELSGSTLGQQDLSN